MWSLYNSIEYHNIEAGTDKFLSVDYFCHNNYMHLIIYNLHQLAKWLYVRLCISY